MVGRLGEGAMAKQIDGMIPQKLTKVNEAKDSVKTTKYDKSQRKEAAKAKAAAKGAAKKAPGKTTAKKPSMNMADMEEEKKGGGDAMEFDMGGTMDPPKKTKPNLGQKPAVKKKPPAEEEKKEPAKVPGARPAKAAPSTGGTGKTVKADEIQEEDVGEGLSKD